MMMVSPGQKLHDRAVATNSNSLIVLRDGQLDEQISFGMDHDPLYIMSISKFVTGLGLGSIFTAARVDIDQPVAEFFPEWRQGRKQRITIRMLMNHTSGLQNAADTGVDLEAAPDMVQLALCAELDADPGAEFSYNNKAVQLLAGVVQRAAGRSLDGLLTEHLFAPLGIQSASWAYDLNGSPYIAGGLSMSAWDLARIGQLVADGGLYRGHQVIPEEWVATMSAPGQTLHQDFGLLSMRWLRRGTDNLLGVYHSGWLGQYLVVCGEAQLVAVRTISRERGIGHDGTDFADFLDYLEPMVTTSQR